MSAAAQTQEPVAAGYTVLARRYRPGQFDDCIGQEHVAQALKNAIKSGRVAHAYLFTGARGVGKTSMARILAKALNCDRGPTTEPCGECDICQRIATGEDVDVIEIDGASNRGIDEIRDLRQGVSFRPSRTRFKIYIIDEVHMLTKEAFNALLKTLEEPPPHVKFLFATTEPQKIPITILSRCQRFDFAGVELPRIVGRLKEIVEAEGMHADDEAIEIIARRAGGSMRDSQSLLDQLLAFGQDRLTADDVHRVLGTAGDEQILGLAGALFTGDAARCLALVEAAVAKGTQLGEWVEQMLDYLRDLLVLSVHPQAQLVSMPNRMRPQMQSQAKELSPERLIEMMDLLAACRSRMQSSTYGRTLLEVALVRLCRLDQFLSLSAALESGPPAIQTNVPSAPSPALDVSAKKNGAAAPALTTENAAAPPPAIETVALSESTVATLWQSACAQLGDAILQQMLGNAEAPQFEAPNRVRVAFASDLAAAKAHCEQPARLSKIEQACSRLAGRPVAVSFSLSAHSSVRPKRESQAKLRELAAKTPLVAQAQRVLGAKLLAVEQSVEQSSNVAMEQPNE